MAPLLIAGPTLFAAVFGEAWRNAGEMTRLLVPMYLARFVVTPVAQTLNVSGRQSQQLLVTSLAVAVLAISFVIAWRYKLEPLTTILIYGVGSSLTYLLYFCFAYRAARGLAKLADGERIRQEQISTIK